MKEDFLHYIWKTKRFDWKALYTTAGQAIEVLDFGRHNFHSGPDFSEGKIKIDDTIWVGNIEIHIRSSQWVQHGHQADPKYDNIILHVVFQDDQPVHDSKGNQIPTIELKDRIDLKLVNRYQYLIDQKSWVPCEKSLFSVSRLIRNSWKDRLMVERLESKTKVIEAILKQTKGDWEEAFYKCLSKTFGMKVNATGFELLSASINLKTLLKYKNRSIQIEALLFGQSGFLEQKFNDAYPIALQQHYQLLRNKHNLKPIDNRVWNFMRLRPANFPTIRIAQFAQLIFQSNHLFSKILAVNSISEVENMFEIKLSNYWKNHYRFDNISINRSKKLGRTSIHLLLINTIVPFLFFYGKHRKEEKYVDKALDLIRQCKPESNSIIDGWKKLNMEIENASDTQALLHLKKHYCSNKRCMSCAIGAAIVK